MFPPVYSNIFKYLQQDSQIDMIKKLLSIYKIQKNIFLNVKTPFLI